MFSRPPNFRNLHNGIAFRNGRFGRSLIAANVWWLCVRFFALSECSNLAQCLKAKTDAKPLLSAVFLQLFKSELLTIKYKNNVKRTINNL